jgi:hypothetical protein
MLIGSNGACNAGRDHKAGENDKLGEEHVEWIYCPGKVILVDWSDLMLL